MLLQCRLHGELREILPQIDTNAQALFRMSGRGELSTAKLILERVQAVQETLHHRDLVGRYPEVHEVVSFMYLSCFSLLYMEGESFLTYREEVKRRYKTLLRTFRFFPQYGYSRRMKRRISNM
ncbi:hypothetical protein SAMN05444487_102190 [Marininema mesophilum]|uniref:Uncharacterized protein n=1 Tax=Marininema mesophilum TaxID=1048340 RepID=A0A1H2SEP5_9BACL|nr:hypothetical protein [Marininema mesophilum]SDW29997.1 hypothetical protein SAMN05444487_102190 [Marininema mesophilum]